MLRPVILVLVGWAALVLLGWMVGELVTGAAFLVDGVDRPVMRWVARNRHDLVDPAMRAVTHLGDRPAIIGILGAAAAVSAAHRARRWAAFLLSATLGALVLSGTIKQLVDRPRPDFDRLVEIGGLAFPSGHATGAAICYGALALAALAVRTQARIVTAVLCALVVVAVAASRVWLGVHYPTDVVAGIALGSAWVAICYLAFLREGSVKPGVYPAGTGRRGRVA